MRAVDYIREHGIEHRIEEYIAQVVHERPADPYGVLAGLFASQAKPATIDSLKGSEIILSTGRASLNVDVYAMNLGRVTLVGSAQAPIGVSVFTQESKLCLDGNANRFLGLGSRNACAHVEVVSSALAGKEFTTIDEFDALVKKALEGRTEIVNILNAVSFALARASATIMDKPLFLYLYESMYPQQAADSFTMPTPAVSVIEGGMHGLSPLAFESIMVIPKQTWPLPDQLRACSEVSHKLKQKIHGDAKQFPIGKCGGLVADMAEVLLIIPMIERAIVESGFTPGKDFTIGLDCAASHFYDPDRQKYQLESGVTKSAAELVQFYIDLVTQYPSVTLINDGVSEIDHAGWELMRDALLSRIKVFGGDVYASQAILARRGLKKRWTDGILIQLGQAGTLTDAAETGNMFKQRGKVVAVGRRAGESCDSILTDFAIAIESEYIMAGGMIGSEGISKYNELLRAYEYLREKLMLQS